MTGPIPCDVAERAATRYQVVGECWISTYSVGSHGYAQIGWQRRGPREMTTAHRAAWTHHHGPISDGLTVDHVKATGCADKRCVNPAHLRLLTNLDNATGNGSELRRTATPVGRSCGQGHPLVRTANGRQAYCRVCSSASRRARRAATLPAST